AYEFSWPARPCLTALFQAFLYSCVGRVDEGAARLLHVGVWASLLALFHADLSPRLGANRSLLWTAVLATVPDLAYHASAGVGNLALGVYLFAVLSSLDRAARRPRALLAPALLLGGAFYARDEGLVLGSIAVLCAFFLDPAAGRGVRLRGALLPCAG